MSIYEIDTGGVERIRGTLHTEGGAPGDVPVQQANGSFVQAPGGGSMAGGVRTLGPFPIAFDDAGLNDGITIWTPPDTTYRLLDAWFEIDQTLYFDGTTPKGDIGTDAVSGFGGAGWFTNFAGAAVDMTESDTGIGYGLTTGNTPSLFEAIWFAASGGYGHQGKLDNADPIKAWVSQDGLKGGAAVGGSQGLAGVVLVVSSPSLV